MIGGRRREHGVDEEGEVLNLYQGEAPVSPRDQRGTVYPDDRRIRDDDNISIQIHTLNVTREGSSWPRTYPFSLCGFQHVLRVLGWRRSRRCSLELPLALGPLFEGLLVPNADHLMARWHGKRFRVAACEEPRRD